MFVVIDLSFIRKAFTTKDEQILHILSPELLNKLEHIKVRNDLCNQILDGQNCYNWKVSNYASFLYRISTEELNTLLYEHGFIYEIVKVNKESLRLRGKAEMPIRKRGEIFIDPLFAPDEFYGMIDYLEGMKNIKIWEV